MFAHDIVCSTRSASFAVALMKLPRPLPGALSTVRDVTAASSSTATSSCNITKSDVMTEKSRATGEERQETAKIRAEVKLEMRRSNAIDSDAGNMKSQVAGEEKLEAAKTAKSQVSGEDNLEVTRIRAEMNLAMRRSNATGRKKCQCRCDCKHSPGSLIQCPRCAYWVGPGCATTGGCWRPEAGMCHFCQDRFLFISDSFTCGKGSHDG